MEPLFRFITVRNPRKPTSNELNTGFIFYDTRLEAPLLTRMLTELSGGNNPAGALEALALYKKSQQFIRSTKDLEEKIPGLSKRADWLAESAHRFTVSHYEELRSAPGFDVIANKLGWLWDNLLVYTYAGGIPELREIIIWSIRVANLLSPRDEVDDEAIHRIARSTVVLPSEAHLAITGRQKVESAGKTALPAPADETSVSTESTDATESQGQDEVARIQAAYDELSRQFRDVLERERSAEVEPLQVPHINDQGIIELPESPSDVEQKSLPEETPSIDRMVFERLGEETRSVLEELGLQSDVRIPYALQRLQTLAGERAKEIINERKASLRVAKAGGAFWSTGKSPQSTAGQQRNPFRQDEPYHRFFAEPKCKVKPLGVADFRRVEQRLYCYEAGEVAHIENVLIGESKERNTRRLRRTEQFVTVATEEERTEERDTQTTERFELQKEVSKVVEQQLSFDLGVQVAVNYGTLRITADTNFAYSNSTVESDKMASKYAREVTEQARERIVNKVREERSTKTIEEFEETNKHSFDNAGGSAHIVGLYRWVDKIYEAKIVNYGKRLMFEFLVPEPGAFHLYAMADARTAPDVLVERPIDPRSEEITTTVGLPRLTSHESITELNYAAYAALYEAKPVPPPPLFITSGKAYHIVGLDHNIQFSDSKNDFKLPEGFEAVRFDATFGLHSETHDGGPNWITIAVGRRSRFTTSGGTFSGVLDGEDDIVPIIVMGRTRFYALDLEVVCQRTPAALDAWKIKTFNAILDAYVNQLGNYNTALADARARASTETRGTNPGRNREIERLELEKGCVRLLAQECQPHWSDAMYDDGECGYPEFDCCAAISDGTYVQFIEQAFEWRLMTYLFYPYFWGRKCNWKKLYQLENADPVFLAFLQAGFARVVVPVREGYEEAALRFLADGIVWNGGSVPGIDDPMYLSMANEMKEPVGEVDPSVEPWLIHMPTSLNVLQCESGCVEGNGLPCPHNEDTR
jgi:hypothetical protein